MSSFVRSQLCILTLAAAVGVLASPVAPVAADGPTPAVCYYHSSPPNLSSGAPDTCELDASGNLKVGIGQLPAAATLADGTATPSTTLMGTLPFVFNSSSWNRLYSPNGLGDGSNGSNTPTSAPYAYNGASYDRLYNNLQVVVVTAASYSTTATSADQTNFNGRGVKCVLNVSSAGSGSITPEIDGKDGASGSYYPLLTGTAVTANGATVLTVYPGVTPAANNAAADVVPRTWRAKVTANNANPVSYSVGCTTVV